MDTNWQTYYVEKELFNHRKALKNHRRRSFNDFLRRNLYLCKEAIIFILEVMIGLIPIILIIWGLKLL